MLRSRLGSCFVSVGYLASIVLCTSLPRVRENNTLGEPGTKDASVLILGGGVSGIIAARTLGENGITNFRIVEARDELGGRLRSIPFGASGKQRTVEVIPPPPRISQVGSSSPPRSAQTGFKGQVGDRTKGRRTRSGGSSRNTGWGPSTTPITKACVRLNILSLHGLSAHKRERSNF